MRTYHMVGVGGAGMSALARVLHARGYGVTGSDQSATALLAALETEIGVALTVGHAAGNVGRVDTVVASAAIKDDNPELVEARRRGIPVISRAELLGEILNLTPTRIAVTGTHGKTTTSAMAAQMLEHAGLDPTALIGSEVPAWRSNTRIGQSGIVVAEACEAYGSFLDLRPTHAIVTNIEADHLDHYGSMARVVDAFRKFAAQTTKQLIVCGDGGADRLLAGASGAQTMTYGLDGGSELTATIVGDGEFVVHRSGRTLGRAAITAPGRHNIANALAVFGLGFSLGMGFESIVVGLAQFRGTSRRFEMLMQSDALTIVDDYAHHPTEIAATLAAARARFPQRRIVALFQPHLPSRTRDLFGEFSHAFGDADLVIITDIYLAREAALPGTSSELLARQTAARSGALAVYGRDLGESGRILRDILRPRDVLLTLGAGDVRLVGESLRDEFGRAGLGQPAIAAGPSGRYG